MQDKERNFWSDPGRDKNLTANINSLYKRTNILQLTMVAGVIVVMQIYFLIPYFSPSTVYLFISYVFVNSTIVDVVLLICQYYVVLIILPIALGYDNMYLCLCIELVVQVKLLKREMKEAFRKSNGDVVKSIAKCVEQHNFLLS